MTAVANEQSVPFAHDPVLLPFLTAADAMMANVALTTLLAEQVEPRLREIVHYKLRSFAGSSDEREECADVCNDILVQLLTQLAELRANPFQKTIHNFRSYVAVAAYRGCYDYLRRKYPQRHSLKHKLRYALSHDSALACWQSDSSDDWICGLASWRGNAAVQSESRLQELREQSPGFVRKTFPHSRTTSLPDLLKAFLAWAGQPLALDDLVGIIADLQGIKEKRNVQGAAAEEAFAQVPDQRASVVDDLSARAYLKQLWQEIAQMTPRHCAALLLNLRDDQGGCAIDLFLFMGVVTLQQIAAVMAMTEAELASLWQHLPLEDAVIAERLQLTRQQVINLRRSARERLARRLSQSPRGRDQYRNR